MNYVAAFILLATPALAEPIFEDMSGALPEHIYAGGWEHFVGGGVAVFDCNNDQLPDIFAVGGENAAILLKNDGQFTFSQMPIPEITGATGAYPLDLNADGFMDIFVMRNGPNMVLQGHPDCIFTDASTEWGIPAGNNWTTAFTAWWDGDDQPVMAIGNYVDTSDPDGPFEACDSNTILRPNDGYQEESLTPGFCALSMLATHDARGRLTLRISNDRHYYVRNGHEQMWDIAQQRFLGPEDGWQNLSLWGMGIASRDLDGDGRDEVMLTSMGDQLLQQAQPDGTYLQAPFSIGTYAQRPHIGADGRPSTGWHAEFGDINNDGMDDLFIAKGNVDQMPGNALLDPNNLLIQQSDGTFREVSVAAGIATTDRSRGAALVDFDLDGRLDLVVMNRRAAMELYRNVSVVNGNWLSVALTQSGGNRNAVGAEVMVSFGEKEWVQRITVGGGHASGEAGPLHYGLGNADTVTVSIIWPNGEQQEITSVSTNAALQVRRAE